MAWGASVLPSSYFPQQILTNRNQSTDCIMDKILKKVGLEKFITTALKSILKLVKLLSLVVKRCKMWKMYACEDCKFVYFCITHEKLIPTSRNVRYQFSVRNTKVYKIRKISRAIFSSFYNILQPNFAILPILGCSSMLYCCGNEFSHFNFFQNSVPTESSGSDRLA